MKVPPVPAVFAEPGVFCFLYKPSPWGEGAPVRTLGRMRGQILDWVRYMQREFRRLRAASYFAHGGKVTKTPLGDAADGHFVPIGPLTPSPPLRGTRTCKIEENFRRAKSEWPSKFLPPHWGLAKRKIKAGAISVLRLALPSRRLLPLGVGAAHWAARFRYEIRPIARRGRCPHRPVVGGVAGEMGSLLSAPRGRFPPLSFVDTPVPAALPGGRAARW